MGKLDIQEWIWKSLKSDSFVEAKSDRNSDDQLRASRWTKKISFTGLCTQRGGFAFLGVTTVTRKELEGDKGTSQGLLVIRSILLYLIESDRPGFLGKILE